MSEYDLSPAQVETWKAVSAPWFQGVTSNLALARQMRQGKYDKSLAGYLGEFRRGGARGLRRILGSPVDLDTLCVKLGIEVDDVERAFQRVRHEANADSDLIWLPGFEDLGQVPLSRGLVAPRIRHHREVAELRFEYVWSTLDDVFESREASTASLIVARRCTGLTTVLQAWAANLRTEGWQVAWWRPGVRPVRGCALIVDAVGTAAREETDRWVSGGYGPVIEGVVLGSWPAVAGMHLVNHERQRLETAPLALFPVTLDWLVAYRDSLIDHAPRRMRAALRRMRRSDLGALLEGRDHLGPLAAGCLLRAAVDGLSADLAVSGPRLLADRARRILGTSRDGRAQVAALQGVEAMLPEVGLRVHCGEPIEGWFEDRALAEAQEVIDQVQATALQRDILRRALPSVSGRPVLDALIDGGVLQDGDDLELGALQVHAPSIATVLLEADDCAARLRRLLLESREELLFEVLLASGGPRLGETLRDLSAPEFLVATERVRLWGPRFDWPQDLLDRWVATRLTLGGGDQAAHPEAHVSATGDRRSATVTGVCRAIEGISKDVGRAWDLDDLAIAYGCAWLVPTPDTLASDAPWLAAHRRGFLPAAWPAVLGAEHAATAIDPTQRASAWVIATLDTPRFVQLARLALASHPTEAGRCVGRALRWSLDSLGEGPLFPRKGLTFVEKLRTARRAPRPKSPYANASPSVAVLVAVRRVLEAYSVGSAVRVAVSDALRGWSGLPDQDDVDLLKRELVPLFTAALPAPQATALLRDRAGNPTRWAKMYAGAVPVADLVALREQHPKTADWIDEHLVSHRGARGVEAWGASGVPPGFTLPLALNPAGRSRLWELRDRATGQFLDGSREGMHEVDRPHLMALCRAADTSMVSVNRLAEWSVEAEVAVDAVLHLVRHAPVAPGSEWLPTVLLALHARDSDAVATWLREGLPSSAAVVAHLSMEPVWSAGGFEPAELIALATAHRDAESVDAPVAASVRAMPELVDAWLLDERTVGAALVAMEGRPDEQLQRALERMEGVPSDAVLRRWLASEDRRMLRVLDAAVNAWEPERRRAVYLGLGRVEKPSLAWTFYAAAGEIEG